MACVCRRLAFLACCPNMQPTISRPSIGLGRRNRRILKTLDLMADLLLAEHEAISGQILPDHHFVGGRHEPDMLVSFSNIVMDRFWLGLDIADIPDPLDADPIRAALKACIVEQMVAVQIAVWDRLSALYGAPKRLAGTVPAWAIATPPSPIRIWLIPAQMASANLNQAMLSKNVVAFENFMHYC